MVLKVTVFKVMNKDTLNSKVNQILFNFNYEQIFLSTTKPLT